MPRAALNTVQRQEAENTTRSLDGVSDSDTCAVLNPYPEKVGAESCNCSLPKSWNGLRYFNLSLTELTGRRGTLQCSIASCKPTFLHVDGE